MDLKDTIVSLKTLSLPSNHPVAQQLKSLSQEDKSFKQSFEELQRKLASIRKEMNDHFKEGTEDANKKRFYKLVDSILQARPENPNSKLLAVMEELHSWKQGNAKFITDTLLAQARAAVSNTSIFVNNAALDPFKQWLLQIDTTAIGIDTYSKSLLEDPNAGHWDIYPYPCDNSSALTFEFESPLQARHPLAKGDIKPQEVAIDFGTKSTVAAFLDQHGVKKLISISTLNTKDYENPENPTVVEFRYHKKFKDDYNALDHRPPTNLNDFNIAHGAFEAFQDAKGNDYYRFFSKLKQWAGTMGTQLKIMDFEEIWNLGDLSDYGAHNPSPIEIYAYLLGRHINNMHGGVYLKYFLSFPTKYEPEQREAIRTHFERGLKKSLPLGVFDPYKTPTGTEKQHNLQVELRISEPAAYAITALQEFGLDQGNEIINYGVFDFGGGTTDFDFGVWEASTDSKYDFELHHFGEEGMKFLGGENLLEYLAFHAFIDNLEEMRAKGFVLAIPHYDTARFHPQDLRNLRNESREGRRNLQTIAEALRDFVENLDKEKLEGEEFDTDEIDLDLFDRDGKGDNACLNIDYPKLFNILKTEIKRGVDNFFHALRIASKKMKNATTIHIFLGGNASRSPLVSALFEEAMAKAQQEHQEDQSTRIGKSDDTLIRFELYPPLGTEQADAIIRARTGREPENRPYLKATSKTGVVFGLLDSRDRLGGIKVCGEVYETSQPIFHYFLGREKSRRFISIVDRREMEVGKWLDLYSCVVGNSIEIFYTDKSQATSNQLDSREARRKVIDLDQEYSEKDVVKVCMVNTKTIKVGIFSPDGDLLFEEEKHLD
ncbi:hypothetical protein [Helicobacter suis]|uniref:hypothetical protein n=1 Tax=Helicobacter suis TaxID=104628 RepID=UPI0013D13D1D|nr:hypothetical protein [Helicobacter suis]